MDTQSEVWQERLSPARRFSAREPRVLSLAWDNKWPRAVTAAPGSLGCPQRPAASGPASPGRRGWRAMPPSAPQRLRFHFSFPGLSHFLSHRSPPVRPPSPGPHLRAVSSASRKVPAASPRGLKGGKFLWVPGVPRVRSRTGNCKSPQPSALPRGFPVMPAPRRSPRS